jgi:hypothetical protein
MNIHLWSYCRSTSVEPRLVFDEVIVSVVDCGITPLQYHHENELKRNLILTLQLSFQLLPVTLASIEI